MSDLSEKLAKLQGSSMQMQQDSVISAQKEAERQSEMMRRMLENILRPVLSPLAELLKNNTAALEQLSSAQSIQNDRLAALEKQIRLQMPITSTMQRYLNDAIRARARELLDKYGVDDKKAITKISNAIRRSVLARYGICNLREIPKHEYDVARSQIGMWKDALILRDVVKEARESAERQDTVAESH